MARVPLAAAGLLSSLWLFGSPGPAHVVDSSMNPGNEMAAVVSLKTLATGQLSYRLTCGNGGYAATLPALAVPPGGHGDGFITGWLGSSPTPQKSGYSFAMTAGKGSAAGPKDCNGIATVTRFYATAVPTDGSAGTRSFAVNQDDVIWQVRGQKAPTEPFKPPAAPIK